MTDPLADYNPKRGVEYLRKATGLGRDTVRAAIIAGQLPGALVGRSYVVPKAAYLDFIHGRWVPRPRTVLVTKPAPNPLDFIHQEKAEAS